MTWLDTVIVTVIVVLGLAILYKGLKEPIDMVVGWIVAGFRSIFADKKEKVNEIVYG